MVVAHTSSYVLHPPTCFSFSTVRLYYVVLRLPLFFLYLASAVHVISVRKLLFSFLRIYPMYFRLLRATSLMFFISVLSFVFDGRTLDERGWRRENEAFISPNFYSQGCFFLSPQSSPERALARSKCACSLNTPAL